MNKAKNICFTPFQVDASAVPAVRSVYVLVGGRWLLDEGRHSALADHPLCDSGQACLHDTHGLRDVRVLQ